MFKAIYRISDNGNPLGRTDLTGHPLNFITRKHCLKIFIDVFGVEDLMLVMDNCCDETISWIDTLNIQDKFITTLGNIKSFKYILDYSIKLFDDNDIVYFIEDDYLHLQNSKKYIEEGLEKCDYVSLYDSLDKYKDSDKGGYNPLIRDGGEDTKVIITNSSHWKLTNATTMSFAAKVKTLKEDYNIMMRYLQDHFPHPMDFDMFRFLIVNNKRKLMVPIPGKSAHIGLEMSPFIDWVYEARKVII